MFDLDSSVNEFIAKIIADLGKAILTVGFASYFFEKLPLPLRIGCSLGGLMFIVISVYIYAKRKGE